MTIAPELYGLVLVGGRSTRMGRDKAMLDYVGRPQAVVAYELLSGCCRRVFLSCRRGQAPLLGLPAIFDAQDDIGPMAGILAAFQAHPAKAWLVLACDLPFLTAATLRHLIAHRDPTRWATVYRSAHDGLPEPLCAIYEPAIAGQLREFAAAGQVCPRKALIQLGVPLQELPEAGALDNVNDPQDWERVRARLARPAPGAPGAARAQRPASSTERTA